MKNKKTKRPAKKSIRLKAEALLKKYPAGSKGAAAKVNKDRMFHELQIHQIELEMQNDELRKVNYSIEEERKKYKDLYDFSTVGFFTLDHDGIILGLNLSGAGLLGMERKYLIKRNFGLFISPETRQAFDGFMDRVFGNAAKTYCEAAFAKKGSLPVYVRIEGTVFTGTNECFLNVMDVTERKLADEKIRGLLAKQ